jgi:DNA-binding LytR/AlgR family response regulator
MVAFTNRYPLHWDTWKRYLPKYVIASLLFSVAHVLAMVALRKLVYTMNGQIYDFGNWPIELFYEYIKDAQSFFGIVITLHAYRWLMRRLQGEASLLALSADETEQPIAAPFVRPERFLVRMLNREFLVAAVDIDWVQASGNYVNLHVAGRVYPLRSTMTQFETQLDPARFVRIHRSHLVNIHQIASIEPLDSGDARVHLHDGTIVACSRRYRDALKL